MQLFTVLPETKNGLIQKKKQGGWGHTFFENPSGIFWFFTSKLETPDKTKFTPNNSTIICKNSWKF